MKPNNLLFKVLTVIAWIIFVGFLILLAIVGYSYYDDFPKNLLIFIVIIEFNFILLFIIGEFSFRLFFPLKYIQKGLIKKYKILIPSDSIEKDKTINNFLNGGWSKNEPSP
jgi:hypothetical protein